MARAIQEFDRKSKWLTQVSGAFKEIPMNAVNKRDRLIESAATLFHRKGMFATSLADIAKDADIPIGNVYYYFKTKEELALSALTRHKEQYLGLFESLNESIDDPRQRLKRAIDHYEMQSDEFTKYGCPVGKIVMDSENESSPIARAASEVLECFLSWAETQFKELGHDDNARLYATSILSGVQGSAILAKSMQNSHIMLQELARLSHFIDQLPNKRIPLGKVAKQMSVA